MKKKNSFLFEIMEQEQTSPEKKGRQEQTSPEKKVKKGKEAVKIEAVKIEAANDNMKSELIQLMLKKGVPNKSGDYFTEIIQLQDNDLKVSYFLVKGKICFNFDYIDKLNETGSIVLGTKASRQVALYLKDNKVVITGEDHCSEDDEDGKYGFKSIIPVTITDPILLGKGLTLLKSLLIKL